jgi:hypothetical protein
MTPEKGEARLMGKSLMHTRHPLGIGTCPTTVDAYIKMATMHDIMQFFSRCIMKEWLDETLSEERTK